MVDHTRPKTIGQGLGLAPAAAPPILSYAESGSLLTSTANRKAYDEDVVSASYIARCVETSGLFFPRPDAILVQFRRPESHRPGLISFDCFPIASASTRSRTRSSRIMPMRCASYGAEMAGKQENQWL
jgi:hypothetical protein